MSHFKVFVFTKDGNIDKALAKFDENKVVKRYVEYTKEQLIENERKSIEDFKNGTYATYLKDPAKYEAKYASNPDHIKYLKEEFPKKLKWTDKQLYKEATRWYEKSDIGPKGEVYSTRNPHSKWDWYQVGGRYAESLKLKTGASGQMGERSWTNEGRPSKPGYVDEARMGDIDWQGMLKDRKEQANKTYDAFEAKLKERGKLDFNPYFDFGIDNKGEDADNWIPETREEYVAGWGLAPFAVVHKGKWYEKGQMGWWAIVSNKKDPQEWENQFLKLLEGMDPEMVVTCVDCHI